MAALKVRDRYLASQDIAVKYPSDIDANGYFIGHPETDVNQVIGLARQNSTAYTAGSIAFSTALPSGLVLECTTAGTTAATEPSYSGAAEGGTVNDGTAVWTYKKLLSSGGSAGGGGVPLAAIIPWVDDVNTVPAGFLKCDGTAVSRTDYADLFGAIGTKYGSGDGSTTFNTPDLTDAAIMNGTYDKTTFTTAGSATFTAPKDGYYKITVKGAGGGGGGNYVGSKTFSGQGGGEGGTTIGYEYMTAGDTATVTIGAGGAGGAYQTSGTSGGGSSVIVNGNTYLGGGGNGGAGSNSEVNYHPGAGGTGTIPGCPGGAAYFGPSTSSRASGGSGGGTAGGVSRNDEQPIAATSGGGGAGAQGSPTHLAGGDGGDGYAWFEYIGTASQYLIKYTPTVIDSEVSAATSASQAQAAAQAAESYAGSAGIPVGTLFPYAADTQTPPTGFLFCNGQAVSRTMYADLFSVLGTTFGPGDGSTTFNLPDEEFLKGLASTAPVYGDGTTPIYLKQVASGDAPKTSHFQAYREINAYLALADTKPGTSVAFPASSDYDTGLHADLSASPTYSSDIHYIIKAYDGVTPGSAGIDLSQYASDLSNKADRSLSNLTQAGEQKLTDTTESVVYEDGFAIIYPNGGTEANPASVAINSRYVESNPFPGYVVRVIAEVKYNNQWGEVSNTIYVSSSQGVGLIASTLDDNIVIQTAITQLLGRASADGAPFNVSGAVSQPLPCRIKVWKIGKISTV